MHPVYGAIYKVDTFATRGILEKEAVAQMDIAGPTIAIPWLILAVWTLFRLFLWGLRSLVWRFGPRNAAILCGATTFLIAGVLFCPFLDDGLAFRPIFLDEFADNVSFGVIVLYALLSAAIGFVVWATYTPRRDPAS